MKAALQYSNLKSIQLVTPFDRGQDALTVTIKFICYFLKANCLNIIVL